ncbi:hypothetical protein [Nocardia sp. NPDC057353]|uniref:hypothetical protein n=1 Tax=Nocardia sp. NPDC057353 TaxID=3346104 RepID=UPI003625FF21
MPMRIRGRARVRLPRRQPNTFDYVGEHVANSFLAEDLDRAWSVLSPADRELITFLLDTSEEADSDADKVHRLIGRLSGSIRVNAALRGRLLVYLGDRVPAGLCLWCGRELPPPARPRRPRKYCGATHRQSASRARRRQAEAAE